MSLAADPPRRIYKHPRRSKVSNEQLRALINEIKYIKDPALEKKGRTAPVIDEKKAKVLAAMAAKKAAFMQGLSSAKAEKKTKQHRRKTPKEK